MINLNIRTFFRFSKLKLKTKIKSTCKKQTYIIDYQMFLQNERDWKFMGTSLHIPHPLNNYHRIEQRNSSNRVYHTLQF